MTTMASQITSLTIVYLTVYSDADQRIHQSSASLAFVWGIHRDRWIPRTKGKLRGKCFHLMTSSCFTWRCTLQCGAGLTRSISSQILTILLATKATFSTSFGSSKSNVCYPIVTTLLYLISCYVGPCYKVSLLHNEECVANSTLAVNDSLLCGVRLHYVRVQGLFCYQYIIVPYGGFVWYILQWCFTAIRGPFYYDG